MGFTWRRWIVLALVAACFGASSGQDSPAYEVDPAVDGIAVSGRAVYVGGLPKTQYILVHRDRAFCGHSVPNEALVVDRESRGIAAVVVSLEGVHKGKSFSDESTAVIENRSCRFEPRALGASNGTLEIRNSDPILHNTHVRKDSQYGPNVVNVVQPPRGNVISKPLRQTGILDVRCDAHPFMQASIHVFDHPYFAVTNEAGEFRLSKVPPGSYRLRIWHQTLGIHERPITVPTEGSVPVTIELGPEV
jgi:hypothetical protein